MHRVHRTGRWRTTASRRRSLRNEKVRVLMEPATLLASRVAYATVGIWDQPMRGDTRQRLLVLKRPYKPPETTGPEVESFSLHSSTAWGHPSADLIKEIGDGVVISHTHTITVDGTEIFTLVVTDS
jgi:hypothetical protein